MTTNRIGSSSKNATEASNEELPKWLPYSIYVATQQINTEKALEPQDITENFFHRYGGTRSKNLDSVEFRIGSFSCYVSAHAEQGSLVFLLASGSSDTENDGSNSFPSYEKHDKLLEPLKKILPEKPDFAFTLRLAYATDEREAETLLRRYAKSTGQLLENGGLAKGCVLATLRSSRPSSTPMPSRERIIICYEHGLQPASDIVWTLCFGFCSLAVYFGQMSRLYLEREPMFSQTDASEKSTQLWINEILAKMRRPLDEIQPEDLEAILKEITIQFSRLSTATSSMRRDYIRAQGLLRSLRNLLKGWNEKPIGENITNTSALIDSFENMFAPFLDFIERTEALTVQLNTLLDSVRTYLGIQQQKMSITEQTSSKEQLVRLVNLQEILHKLEILIIAFYLTEMARIVFEALLHESANLLTVAFIPVALFISVFMIRILHKSH